MGNSFGLRSTGLVVFASRLASAFTGLLFIVMVARWLSPASFGTWEVIVTLVTISAYPVGIVAYWATREVARERFVGRTALLAGALMSGGGLVLYFAFTVVTYSRIGASVVPFLIGGVLVPLSYWSAVANSIVQGHRPSAYGYSLMISEVAKLVVAYEALFTFRLGIEGVMLALLAAYFVQSAVSTYLVRATAADGFDRALLGRWSRLSWLPAVSYLPTVLAVADTYVAAVAFGPAIVGYYQVAFTVASVVGYSSALAFSLYPLLLKGGDQRLPAVTMEFALLFGIPMAVGLGVLAGPMLFLFGEKYLPAALAMGVLSAMFVFTTMSNIVDQTLLGTENADVSEAPSFRSLARSNLIFVPVANILFGAAYVVVMFVVLYYSFANGFSVTATTVAWAIVQFGATLVFLGVKARRAVRYAKLMPGISVAWYLLAGGAMGIVVYLLWGVIGDQGVTTVAYGARLLVATAVGAAVYFGGVYALDSKFRELVASVLPGR
jgi:O-antigen/teichoic acid export membrane protein